MKKLKIFIIILCFFLIFYFLDGCNNNYNSKVSKNTSMSIGVSILPIANIVENLVKDTPIKVVCILPPNVSPHTFIITPQIINKVQNISLYFKIGRGLDEWIDKIAKQSQASDLSIIILSKNAPSIKNDELKLDPHIWLDPIIVKENIIPILNKTLIEKYPKYKDKINKNTKIFINKLDNVHKKIVEILKPYKNKYIISIHSALSYFSQRYSLKLVVLETSPGKTPSAKYLKKIINIIKSNKIKCIFIEPQLTSNSAKMLQEDLKLKPFVIDPLGSTLKKGQSYLDLLIYNAKTIAKGLSIK